MNFDLNEFHSIVSILHKNQQNEIKNHKLMGLDLKKLKELKNFLRKSKFKILNSNAQLKSYLVDEMQ